MEVEFPPVNIRETSPNDLDAALRLNNSNVPALNELDEAEIARLVSIAEVALTAEVDGAFAGFCIVFAPGVDYGSLNYGWFSRNYDRLRVPRPHRRRPRRSAATASVARFYGELVRARSPAGSRC